MKNMTMLAILAILVIGGLFFVFAKSDNSVTGAVIQEELKGQTQKVVLSEKNFNYFPSTVTVKAGEPVSLSLDESVTGCLRAFTIRELGVSKYLQSTDDELIFTPTEKGSYTFSCSMGMGYGTLVVE